MKSLLLLACTLIIGLTPMLSQADPVKRFYNQYKDFEDVTHIKLQGWLLRIASNYADDADAEKLLKKVTHLRIITMEDGSLVTPASYNKLLDEVRKDSFEDLLQLREGSERIDMLFKEKKGEITDVLLLISGDGEFLLLSLQGHLKFSDLNDLDIDVDGGNYFKQIPEDKAMLPKA